MTPISFDDQVAVVTGAGNGLGRTYALELARRGARVVVNDLGRLRDGTGDSTNCAEAVVAEIVAAGGEAVANTDSVATPEGGEAMVKAAIDAFGRIDIVIHNAGILRDRSFTKISVEDLDAVLDVHLRGAFFVAQPAFRQMKEQGYGRFLFTTSASGVFGNFGQANYGAAKMGLVGLSNILAIEGARSGITSNVLAPIARTRMTEEFFGATGDILDPELVTPMALYLVSQDCSLTHEAFAAGAGWYTRIFVGVAPGWLAEQGSRPTVEDVRDHLGEIRAEDGYTVPMDADAAAGPVAKMLA